MTTFLLISWSNSKLNYCQIIQKSSCCHKMTMVSSWGPCQILKLVALTINSDRQDLFPGCINQRLENQLIRRSPAQAVDGHHILDINNQLSGSFGASSFSLCYSCSVVAYVYNIYVKHKDTNKYESNILLLFCEYRPRGKY